MPPTRTRSSDLVPAAAATAALVFFRFYTPPEQPLLVCGFLWLTSLPCPLCGLTRALCSLAKGGWSEALQLNALSPAVFALFVAIVAAGALRLAGLRAPEPWHARGFWTAAALVFAVYGALRIAGLTL